MPRGYQTKANDYSGWVQPRGAVEVVYAESFFGILKLIVHRFGFI